jgi:hypothetical protein
MSRKQQHRKIFKLKICIKTTSFLLFTNVLVCAYPVSTDGAQSTFAALSGRTLYASSDALNHFATSSTPDNRLLINPRPDDRFHYIWNAMSIVCAHVW